MARGAERRTRSFELCSRDGEGVRYKRYLRRGIDLCSSLGAWKTVPRDEKDAGRNGRDGVYGARGHIEVAKEIDARDKTLAGDRTTGFSIFEEHLVGVLLSWYAYQST
jgi:hypothetical protein